MIDGKLARGLSSLEDLEQLFSQLGYDCFTIPLDPATMGASGAVFFAGEWGSLDLYLSEQFSADEANVFVAKLSAPNALRTIALARCDPSGGFSIHVGSCGRARSVAFPAGLTGSSIESLSALQLGSDEYADPGELFLQLTSRESVTRMFFKRFSNSVATVTRELRVAVAGESEEECRRQAILVLSRLLFLHFIQRRGWLDGESRYLIKRFRRAERRGELFYATDLLPLFFGCLNTPRTDRQTDVSELGRIPYLNGGLFQPSRFELANASAFVSNETIGAVLLETFEPFTFVVDEQEGGGSAIDPEMLGRVFEALMAEDERLRSGTFYTPREVVETMSAEAIAMWLAEGDALLAAKIEKISRGDATELDRETALALEARLSAVRVLDPACGSGAFLLSALYCIERLTTRLRDAAALPLDPMLRRRIIESSLFGVDLKPEAVSLCELRLWLSIVTAAECSIDDLLPLPNLDRNIFQGNTLFSPVDALVLDRRDLYHDWLYALRGRQKMIDNYRHSDAQLKRILGNAIRRNDRELVSSFAKRAIDLYEADDVALTAQGRMFEANQALKPQPDPRIAAARALMLRAERDELDFFAYEVHFAHVLAGGGFSVIIGNPPWVRHARLSVDDRRRLSDRYSFFRGSGSLPRQSDLAVAFCEKGVSLLSEGGVLSFLLPSKVLTAAYAAQMRRVIGAECELRSLRDYSSVASGLFDADTFPLALMVRRTTPVESATIVVSSHGAHTVAQRDLILPSGVWSLAPPRARQILESLREKFGPLRQVLGRSPMMGVKTGANHLFLLDDVSFEGGKAVISGSVRVPADALCRTVRGRDLERWRVKRSAWMLWSPAHRWDGCAWLDQLAELFSVSRRDLYLSYVRPEHFGTKVAWKDLSRGMQAAVLPASTSVSGCEVPLIPNQTLYFIDAASLAEAYAMSAVLNSTVFGALAAERCERAKDSHFRYFGRSIAELPLPPLITGSRAFSELVRRARQAHAGSVVEELDLLVAELYGVNGDDLAALRDYLEESLA